MKKQSENHTEQAASGRTDRKVVLLETLRNRVLDMSLPPGAVVDEVAIAEEFGLSRPPVRELMRQLAAEGYIELEPNRPARVSPMDYQALHSFFLAAPLIYVATTQLAARHATAEDIARLKNIQARFRQAIADNNTAQRVVCNNEFHLAIGEIARNEYLMPSLRRLMIDHARLGKNFYRSPATDDMAAEMNVAVAQHDEIIAAIEQRDLKAAEAVVRAHWELSRRRMADYVMPDGVNIPLQI